MMMMKINDYDLDIVVQGFPGKSVCHGGLGWSSVVLPARAKRIVLIDTGNMSMRPMLLKRFAAARAQAVRYHRPAAHAFASRSFDQLAEFAKARIVIGAHELEWSVAGAWGMTPVPEFTIRELNKWPALHKAAEGEEVFPGITAHLAPGHTPGCLVYVLHAPERDVIFAGDAAKNRAEMVSAIPT